MGTPRAHPVYWCMRVVALIAVLGLVATGTAGADNKASRPPVLAYASDSRGNLDLFATTLGQAKRRRLTSLSRDEFSPSWSPDGRHIAFMSERGGAEDVFVMNADGGDVRNLTATPEVWESHPAWMPDGRLSFTRHAETGPIELWSIDANGENARRLATPAEPIFVFSWKRSR